MEAIVESTSLWANNVEASIGIMVLHIYIYAHYNSKYFFTKYMDTFPTILFKKTTFKK